jgi:hypothetical protein
MSTDLEYKRERAQLKRDERAAKRSEKAAIAAARAQTHREQRAERASRRASRCAALAEFARRLRPIAPLLVVTGAAVYAQVSYGYGHYSPADWPIGARFAIAVGAALGIESIALYVQWHAHDSLLRGATATAARQRRASYLIALAVAGVAYAYFSDNWRPTPAACVFALFSAVGPWLWGLHTRRVHHMQLLREGQVDSSGAVFSAERWRAFPIRTFMARRWSIDYGITDPRQAWESYRAEQANRQAATPAEPAQPPVMLVEDEAAGLFSSIDWEDLAKLTGDAGAAAGGVIDRRNAIDVERDGEVIDDLRAMAKQYGRRYSRDEVKEMYGMGSPRATRLLNLLGWMARADDQADGAAR